MYLEREIGNAHVAVDDTADEGVEVIIGLGKGDVGEDLCC